MASADSIPEDTTIPRAQPERWETAVEDLAQLIALGLDRAQDLADVIAELNRTRPGLTKAVAAGVGGAVAGAIVAGIIPRRKPSAKERAKQTAKAMKKAAASRVSALEQAAIVAQAAAQRLAERAPSPSDLRERVPSASGLRDRLPSVADIRSRLPGMDRGAIEDSAAQVQDRARRRISAPAIGKSTVGNAAKLVPIILALLRNPIVRDLLWRTASSRMGRRR